MHGAGKLPESMQGRLELVGENPFSNSPYSASWQQLLEDAGTVDRGRPAGELCLQLSFLVTAWLYIKVNIPQQSLWKLANNFDRTRMYSMHNMQNCNSHSIMSSSIHLCSLTLGIVQLQKQLHNSEALKPKQAHYLQCP